MKILVDVDYSDGQAIIMAPVGDYTPGQIREIERVLASRKIILLPPVRHEDQMWDKILRR